LWWLPQPANKLCFILTAKCGWQRRLLIDDEYSGFNHHQLKKKEKTPDKNKKGNYKALAMRRQASAMRSFG
jgi:hypothetical protein